MNESTASLWLCNSSVSTVYLLTLNWPWLIFNRRWCESWSCSRLRQPVLSQKLRCQFVLKLMRTRQKRGRSVARWSEILPNWLLLLLLGRTKGLSYFCWFDIHWLDFWWHDNYSKTFGVPDFWWSGFLLILTFADVDIW